MPVPSIDDIVQARKHMKEQAQRERDEFRQIQLDVVAFLNNEDLLNDYLTLSTPLRFGGGYEIGIMIEVTRNEILKRMTKA